MTAHASPPATAAIDQARRFLAKAVPWPENSEGYVNIHWSEKKPGATKPFWSGRACRTLDEAMAILIWITSQPGKREIYLCMSSQQTAEEKTSKNGNKYLAPIRNQRNAFQLKSLFIDVDFKGGAHGYETQDDAVKALAAFIKTVGLPKPSIIVMSGGGVHLYFTLSRPLAQEKWQQLAHSLAEAGKRHGFKADWQVTIDSARLLRIPGTENNKLDSPRPVTLAGNPKDFDYDPDQLSRVLEPYKVPLRAAKQPASALVFEQPPSTLPSGPLPDGVANELSAGIDKREYAPVHLDDLAKECGFIREAIATGGQTYAYPMWNLTTLLATFTDDARNDAHRMGDQHPDYTKESTDEFFDRKVREKDEKGLGFPNCATISASGCTACQSCPHITKGRSPLAALLRRAKSPTSHALNGISHPDPLDFHKLSAAEVVRRINLEFFVLRSSGKIYREGEGGELSALPKSDFRTAMGGRLAEYTNSEGEPKVRSAATTWHDSPYRREYAGLEYCPESRGCRSNYKNLWRGWGIAASPGDCSVIIDHTYKILANGDDAKANFLLDWQADILQNPTRKPGVAVVLRGGQGSGKTVAVEHLRKVLGPANVLVTPEKDRMLGRFNAAVVNKILLVGEEMLFAGDHATTDKLKHLITGQTIPVEFKFGDQLEVKSFHRLILTSNHTQVFQAASEERRFVTYDVSDARRGDADYFDRLYAVADGRDDAAAAAFMHHLLTRDITGFKPWKAQQGFANDAALQKQKLLSFTPPIMWLHEIVETVDGQGPTGHHDWIDGLPYAKAQPHAQPNQCKWPPQFSRREAVDAFRAWCTKAKPYGAAEFTGSPERFWSEVHKVIPAAQTSRQISGGVRVVAINLADLQANFDKYLRGEPL